MSRRGVERYYSRRGRNNETLNPKRIVNPRHNPSSWKRPEEYVDWPPANSLSPREKEKFENADRIIKLATTKFEEELGEHVEIKSKTKRVPQQETGGIEKGTALWDGKMHYHLAVGGLDTTAYFEIQYDINGDDSQAEGAGLGVLSTANPVAVRMPQIVANELQEGQSLPLGLAREYRFDPSGDFVVREVGLYGGVTEDNVRELLTAHAFPPLQH